MSTHPLQPWPQVPACYGWLALDQRGQWRLQDELVRHPGLIAFLNAHYGSDQQGCWLVQNGPQQVFVALQAAPWVVRLQTDHSLRAHNGRLLQPSGDFLFDGDSRLFVATTAGAAVLDDRDLAAFIADIRRADGQPAREEELLALLAPASTFPAALLSWQGHRVGRLAGSAAAHFGFVSTPAPATATATVAPASSAPASTPASRRDEAEI